MRDLSGRLVLLTGGSRGIGPEIAAAFIAAGARVVLVARAAGELAATAARLGPSAATHPADLLVPAVREGLVAAVEAAHGPVDVLVNNAGIEEMMRFEDSSLDSISRTLQLNVEAALTLTRQAVPGMLARGHGHVVQMASVAGLAATPYGAVYAASKSALIAATNSLRLEYRGRGVGFSAVCPGFVVGAGMHEVHRATVGEAPAALGSTTPAAVAAATLRAVREDRGVVIVNSTPLRPAIALFWMAPGLGEAIGRRLAGRYMEALARARGPQG